MGALPLPELEVQKLNLHIFILADCSGSMQGQRIAALNQAMRELLPEIKTEILSKPNIVAYIRVIRFDTEATWHVGPTPVELAGYTWTELATGELTATSKAINLLASQLSAHALPGQNCPPVCLLLSDGHCTDPKNTYDQAIEELNKQPFGKKAIRLAIGIGSDEGGYEEKELAKFVNHNEIGVLKAHNARQLLQYLDYGILSSIRAATRPRTKSQSLKDIQNNIELEKPPNPEPTDSMDVF